MSSSRIKIAPNFFLDEYIPKDLYLEYQNRPHILIGLIDRRLVEADQKLREIFGPTTINNWWDGGDRNWSGIRTTDSPYFSPKSQHTHGRASDKLYADYSPYQVRDYIRKHWQQLGITCIEENVSWVHSDVRWWNGNNLLSVTP